MKGRIVLLPFIIAVLPMNAITDIHHLLPRYKQEMQDELASILHYWQRHTIDHINGGFLSKINNENIADATAAKGVVLHARILWTFSAAYAFTQDENHFTIAERAFNFIVNHFKDDEYGGVYWSVDAKGNMPESRKQMYGLAFTLYGMSEWHAASQNETALAFAKELYYTIEEHSFDKKNNGYFEAFARDWQPLEDLRLSAKDANASKTANTHLHIIEAYANLYKVWQDEKLKQKIENLLHLFDAHFIDKNSGHLLLFFDDEWNEQPDVVSYGHDIEAAWLLLQCAEIIGNKTWIKMYRQYAQTLAIAASEGLDKDGGLWYEYEPTHNQLIKQKHWWPQAEAMIGYFNAWQLTGNDDYLQQSLNAWRFTQQYILDKTNGEWFWGVDEAYNIMPNEDKAGFWKCPYHNARACMEVMKRVDISTNSNQSIN